MNKLEWRLRFLTWIRREVCKTPEAEISPKWTLIIYYVLFPSRFFYDHQKGLRYDPARDIFTIYGREYSGQMFRFLCDGRKEHIWFRWYEDERGIVLIETKRDE